ncbi:MAG: hypothetical protein ACI3ZO_08695 [Candidatus Cryptobacteroides sp.]|nr:hypothetical protein [Bacteroidales bacterium]
MKNLNKIFTWLMVALIVVSVGLLVWGFVAGYPSAPGQPDATVEALLYWAYVMVGLALFCVIVIGLGVSIVNNPKSLVKLGIGIAVVAVICVVAYLLAPGSPAVGLTTPQPAFAELKQTDTVLNLTYFTGALAIVAIIFGEIWGAIRTK